MIWKAILVAFLAVGVLAEYKITDEQRQQYKKMIKEACTKNGAADKVEAVEKTVRTFADCVKSIVDINTIKKEIEDAKPRGKVFKKHCTKSTQLKTCLHTLTAGISPCLDPVLREYIGAADDTTDQFIDFVCYKDGERMDQFIAENGPECVTEKFGSISECVTEMRKNIKSIGDAKKLTLTERCAKYDELTACIVKALEECSTPTPGNTAESLFKLVRKTPLCNKN